jgi:transposase
VYCDPVLWLSVRHRVLRKGAPIRQVVREAGISRKTVRKMLAHPLPKPYGPRGRRPGAERAISLAPKPESQPEEARQAACEWMRAVLQKDIDPDALRRDIGDVPDLAHLLRRLYDGHLSDRNRSMTVLASRRGLESAVVRSFLGIDKKTQRRYLRAFQSGGQAALFARQTRSTRKFDSEPVKQAVFRLLHEPPSNHGINRTWTMPDLSRALRETGRPACPHVIRRITKAAGYRWRKARVALTSADPHYAEKLGRIRSILSALGPDGAFVSIDEFGPFAVGMKPGRALSAPGEQRVVPQWQKSRGCLIVMT